MAGLAELNLGAELGDDQTILTLFTAPAAQRPPGLTAWDRAFLGALYHFQQSQRIVRADISGTMTQAVSQ
jgi:hypothetical protein